jgi:hypothetical protein
MALCAQVVYFVWLDLLHDMEQTARIRQITVVQDELPIHRVWVFIEVVDAVCIEEGTTPLDAMYFIPFAKKKLR